MPPAPPPLLPALPRLHLLLQRRGMLLLLLLPPRVAVVRAAKHVALATTLTALTTRRVLLCPLVPLLLQRRGVLLLLPSLGVTRVAAEDVAASTLTALAALRVLLCPLVPLLLQRRGVLLLLPSLGVTLTRLAKNITRSGLVGTTSLGEGAPVVQTLLRLHLLLKCRGILLLLLLPPRVAVVRAAKHVALATTLTALTTRRALLCPLVPLLLQRRGVLLLLPSLGVTRVAATQTIAEATANVRRHSILPSSTLLLLRLLITLLRRRLLVLLRRRRPVMLLLLRLRLLVGRRLLIMRRLIMRLLLLLLLLLLLPLRRWRRLVMLLRWRLLIMLLRLLLQRRRLLMMLGLLHCEHVRASLIPVVADLGGCRRRPLAATAAQHARRAGLRLFLRQLLLPLQELAPLLLVDLVTPRLRLGRTAAWRRRRRLAVLALHALLPLALPHLVALALHVALRLAHGRGSWARLQRRRQSTRCAEEAIHPARIQRLGRLQCAVLLCAAPGPWGIAQLRLRPLDTSALLCQESMRWPTTRHGFTRERGCAHVLQVGGPVPELLGLVRPPLLRDLRGQVVQVGGPHHDGLRAVVARPVFRRSRVLLAGGGTNCTFRNLGFSLSSAHAVTHCH